MIVNAVRSFNFTHFILYPAFKALIMDVFDASSALTNIKEWISLT
jgi:hypothetical protein